MKFPVQSAGLTAFLLLAGISTTRAHSWAEQLLLIASNGTMVGAPGYPRGFVSRASPGFNDGSMTNLIPPNGRSTDNQILPTDLICKSSQKKGNQTPGFPALKASPGDMVAIRYQENGHVTNPGVPPGKPKNGGTIFIYGTQKPSDSDTLLGIHKVWNAAGTGGNGNGVLLATRNFDDGQCYQVNNAHPLSPQRQKQFPHSADPVMGMELWCQSDVTLPSNIAASGSYTLYWVWDWPTGTPGVDNGINEIYTTCMDIDLVPGPGTSKNLNFIKGQDLNRAAIETELSTPFNVPVATTSAPTATRQPTRSTSTGRVGAGFVQPSVEINAKVVTETLREVVTMYQTIYAPPPSTSSSSSSSSSAARPVVTVTTNVVAFETVTVTVSASSARPKPRIRGWNM